MSIVVINSEQSVRLPFNGIHNDTDLPNILRGTYNLLSAFFQEHYNLLVRRRNFFKKTHVECSFKKMSRQLLALVSCIEFRPRWNAREVQFLSWNRDRELIGQRIRIVAVEFSHGLCVRWSFGGKEEAWGWRCSERVAKEGGRVGLVCWNANSDIPPWRRRA